MLIGKKHHILKLLRPLFLSVDEAIKHSYDVVKQPDTLRAMSTRDAILDVKQKLDDLMYKVETRKWKTNKEVV